MMTISVKSWETKNLLLTHVQQIAPSVVVGSASEAPRGFYSYLVGGVDCPLLIGLIVNQSKVPRTLLLSASQRVVLGYDQSVALVDCSSGTLLGTTPLDGVFFEFMHEEERSRVIVVHELGVVAISELGEELWRYTTSDILEDWRRVNDRLVLALMDTNQAIELNLENGTPVKRDNQ